MGRLACVYFKRQLAGELSEEQGSYQFIYYAEYLAGGTPLSFHFPLQIEPFIHKHLFPFFENLVSEGWLRRLQSQQQKIDEKDRFGLLLENGNDLVGAITVERVSI